MENFKELISLCKGSVLISVNDHKDNYESVDEYIDEEDREDIEKEVFDEMVKRDVIVRVYAHPHNPIGFFVITHYDIDKAVNIALDAVKNDR